MCGKNLRRKTKLSMNFVNWRDRLLLIVDGGKVLTSDLYLVGTMNANSFESLTMTKGGAIKLRKLLKQISNVAPNTKWARADHSSRSAKS